MNKTVVSLPLSVLASLLAIALRATTYYASPNGNGTDPTAGFETGYSSVEAAIAAAANAGDEVILDRGTFPVSGTITIDRKITVTGAGPETVLDGEDRGKGTVGTFPNISITGQGAILQNLTITRFGGAYHTLGIYLNAKNACVSNVVMRQNGNGFANGNAYAVISVREGTMHSCVVTNNSSPGGAVVWVYKNGKAVNSYIASNANRGGNASYPGIVYMNGAGGDVRNCTIVNNKSDGGALYHSSGSVKIVNNIVWGNTQLATVQANDWYDSAGGGDWKTNCTSSATGLSGAGNFSSDPLLAPDGLHLLSASPCRGKADRGMAPPVDINGNPRGDAPSLGCIEYEEMGGFTCVISPSATAVEQPDVITLEAVIDGSRQEPLTYSWDFDGDGVEDSDVPAPTLSEIGTYAVSVKVTDGARISATDTCKTELIVYSSIGDVYVTNAVNPSAKAPYATWETAAGSLDVAMPYGQNGRKVVLSDGLHQLTNVVSISFGTTVTSLHGRDATQVWKTGRGSRMFELSHVDAVLEGITITNSDCLAWEPGTAVYIANGTFRDSRICDCTTDGMGIVHTTSKSNGARIERCIIERNVHPADGNQGPVGISLGGTAPVLENCLVVANAAEGGNVVGVRDSAYYGGGLNCQSDSAVIRNCTFADNRCNIGMPLHFDKDPVVFQNGIVIGGMTNMGVSAANDLINWKTGAVIASITNACVWPAAMDYFDKPGVLTADPLFRDRAAGDCHLVGPSSPCWNAGDKTGIGKGAVDLDGLPRIRRGRVDLGCYEDQTVLGLMMLVK